MLIYQGFSIPLICEFFITAHDYTGASLIARSPRRQYGRGIAKTLGNKGFSERIKIAVSLARVRKTTIRLFQVDRFAKIIEDPVTATLQLIVRDEAKLILFK